jgi:hypothetical protein
MSVSFHHPCAAVSGDNTARTFLMLKHRARGHPGANGHGTPCRRPWRPAFVVLPSVPTADAAYYSAAIALSQPANRWHAHDSNGIGSLRNPRDHPRPTGLRPGLFVHGRTVIRLPSNDSVTLADAVVILPPMASRQRPSMKAGVALRHADFDTEMKRVQGFCDGPGMATDSGCTRPTRRD